MSRPLPQPTELAQKVTQVLQRPPEPKKFTHALERVRQKTFVKPAQLVRITATRMAKAERDERMDITLVMTPVKTYMGGFTRPTNLMAAHWFPGGSYIVNRRSYELPASSAYESHTVFLLESRYNIRFPQGRVEAPEYIYGVCREPDFPAVLRNYNSKKAPLNILELMDNARWPWGEQKKRKQVWKRARVDASIESTAKGQPPGPEIPPDPISAAEDVQGDANSAFLVDSSSSGILSSLRAFHSSSAPDAMPESDQTHNSEDTATEDTPLDDASPPKFVPRSSYLPTLSHTPFWRPLLTFTVSTRPLALSLVRLANRLPTGLAFYASISNDDRKCRESFPARIRSLRVRRLQDLALELAAVLAGARGGIPGIRFKAGDIGRAVAGEGLADPIPWDKRVIRVGLGSSLPLWMKEEWSTVLANRASEEVPAQKPFEVALVDDFGRRTHVEDGREVPWAGEEEDPALVMRREEWYEEYRMLKKLMAMYQRTAQDMFKMRESGRIRERFTALVPNPNLPKDSQTSVKAKTQVIEVEKEDVRKEEDEDDEIRLVEDEEELSPSTTFRPLMYIRDAPDALKNLARSCEGYIDENSPLDELDVPINFVVYMGGSLSSETPLIPVSPNPVIGPRDPLTGEYFRSAMLQEMGFMRFVPMNLAYKYVTRRHSLWCVKKRVELSRILSARNTSIDYPDRPRLLC
ncbi:hypothetical protein C8F01DRAFT_26591 [Mycena amicta]|nr:hypothetical protein C8F01DRAFT_26591 [Mycena amicta]